MAVETNAADKVLGFFAASKFAAPAQAAWHVNRGALCERLDAAGDRVRLVIGPPGAGKTALLAQWIQESADTRMCWLHADDGDRDPLRFWPALIGAVRMTEPAFAQVCLDMLRLDLEIDHEWLECFLTESAKLTTVTTVIVDDLHRVGSEVHEQMRFVLERGVEPLRFALGARSEPDLGLHRLRLADRLCEVRESDLRFGRDSARALCVGLDAPVADEALDAIMARTEGWAAAVQLAAIALRDSPQPGEIVHRLAGTNQVIFHYLWAEVFAAQPVEVRRFLLDTCVVDELQPSLAAALSPANAVTLMDVRRLGLMLRRIDGEDDTYRFHHLLTEMLRLRLRADDPAHELVLHERAAGWYEDRGRPVDAFRHRWRAGHRGEALQTMHGTVLDVMYVTLSAMSEAERSLSDDDIRLSPGGALSFATALTINGLVVDALRLEKRVESIASDSLDSADRELLSSVMLNTLFILGDVDAALRYEDRLPWHSPAQNPVTVVARCVVARAYAWQGEFERAAERMGDLLESDASLLHRMEAVGAAAQLQLFRGDLDACERSLEELFSELASGVPNELRDGLLAGAIRGNLELERGEVKAAEDHLRAVSDTRSELRVPAVVLAEVGLARLWAVDGQLDAALAAIDRAYRQVKARPARSGILDHIRRQHARTLLFAGALDEAVVVTDEMDVDEHSRLLLGVEMALARNDIGNAAIRLSALESRTPTAPRRRLDLALARVALGAAEDRPDRSLAGLVLDLVEGDRQIFPLLETTPAALELLQNEARRRQRSDAIDAVVRLRGRIPPDNWTKSPRVDALTERERVVLRYLATSLSYTEIANELHVSRNTIKSHVKNIMQKLHAHTREAALSRARELGYL